MDGWHKRKRPWKRSGSSSNYVIEDVLLPRCLNSYAPRSLFLRALTTHYSNQRIRGDNKIPELQICIAEALYDVDSIVADPGAYTKEELATLHSQIVSNLERAWEITGGGEDELTAVMVQISQVVAKQFKTEKG